MVGIIKNVCVIGAGIMGHGIAELCAIAGYNVILVDINDELLAKALEKIKWSLKKLEEGRKLKESSDNILSRIRTTTNLEEAAKMADYIIEAVTEDSKIKKDVFNKLDKYAKPECVFATNTSTIPISDLAEATNRQDLFIGLHFSNPPVLMPIVEIIMGEKTSNNTLEITKDFARSLGKDFVIVKKDIPGFLINRLNMRVFTEAMRLLEEGYNKEDIDAMVRFRLNLPMGIFELLDFIGIDTVYFAANEMIKRGFHVKMPEILERMVKEGRLGQKSGRGFYDYGKEAYQRVRIVPTDNMYKINPLRILAPAVNEAAWLLRNEISTRDDIDKAMIKAMNYPLGILELADRVGIDNIVTVLKEMYEKTKLEEYNPDPLLIEMLKENKLGVKAGEGFYTWKFVKKEFGPVRYEKRHDHAFIFMCRPEKLNALNEAMWEGLFNAFKEAENDSDVRVVVITGEGRAFSAGDDIAVMERWSTILDAKSFFEKYAVPVIKLLSEYKKPIISLVNGYAFGGGLELNIFCDIVIASENALFSVPEGLIGAFPPIAVTMGVGFVNRKFSRYALTGEWMTAYEAKAFNLVDIVIPEDQLEITGVEFINKIFRTAPLSVEAIKSMINPIRNIYANILETGIVDLILLSASEDFKEGMKAFLERRRAIWRGK